MKPLYQIRKPTSGAGPPAYYSHTGLTQIENCPRRWWLLHAKYDTLAGPYPEPVSSGAMRGSIVHAALERFSVEWSRSGMTKEPGGIKAFRRQFPIREIVRDTRRRLLENARANPRAQMVMLEANVSVDSCISLFKDLVRLGYGQPALESGVAAQRSEDRSEERLVGAPTELIGERAGKAVSCPAVLPEVTLKVENPRVHGKIDLVVTAEEGDSLVEYKTGEPRREHEEQSRLYAFLWWAVTGRVVRERQLLYPNQNPVKLGAMTQAELEEEGRQLRARIVWANGEVESALPSAHLDADRCRSCTVRQLCEEYWTARETAGSRWTRDDAGRPRPSSGNPEWRDLEIEMLQTEQLAEGFIVRGRPKGGAQIVCKIPPQFRASSADSFKNVRFLNVGLVADGEGARLVWSSASEAFWS
jgi:CRISPR/Cas system-associated exonuclease Cas4 (RecB family)